MKHRRKELSEDCWELILIRLAIEDFNSSQSPSLVCKQFLSITDRIRLKLEVSVRLFHRNNCEVLLRSLQQFRNLKEIELHDPVFELDIQFSSYYWSPGRNSNSGSTKYMVTDAGIEAMSLKLRGLCKIDITGQVGCSDRSLIALSSNCVLLNEIRYGSCKVTEHGICFVLRHSRNLICFKAGRYYSLPDVSFTSENSMIYATSLRDLELDPHGNHD
ncbi:hypothetical protein LOK49_LG14G01597 [Camellia lanceoleosa]|uniref:Uncharacterized protein n=1 Tax=Camellia lanceoleosa TaxID=1840588 RepID=A0ACC0F8H5_9ERIC|nr:hypothetical protein LOK49_LG14G01597 [Camellia lanceoleosa]